MLYTIALILLVLWLLGLVSGYTLGGFIYLLLAVAIVMVLFNLVSGRKGTWWRNEKHPSTSREITNSLKGLYE
jgi:hypothetical protein